MAAPIYSYRPEIKIEILDNDITVNLGDKGSCTIRKSLYAPAAEFQLVFPDLPVKAWNGSGGEGPGQAVRESLYGLVNPLDKIIIWVRRWRDGTQSIEPWIPVLTGFVRSVGRDEQVGPDGRVDRQVVVAGQDCGAAFLMEQVSAFITYQNQGAGPIPGPLTWLAEYGLTYDMPPVSKFIWEIATKTTESIMKTAGFEFQSKFSVAKGFVQAHSAFSQEGTIWEMLYRYADGPWNELFVRENRNMLNDDGTPKQGVDYRAKEMIDPELVFRPTPWYDIDDQLLPDAYEADLRAWRVKMAHIVGLRAHRDDAELVNHVWIHSPVYAQAAYTQMVKEMPGVVNDETRAKFGDRIQQEATRLFPGSAAPINQPMGTQKELEKQFLPWARFRQLWMMQAQKRIHDFERGSITLKGYPMMRVGDYVIIPRGEIEWHGYIVNIVHDFQPYRRYLTTLDYIRGNQILKRREIKNPWDKERNIE